MLTYGFYDSVNHDRKYNATQISSIFDGIINDGVYMSIGECFRVKERPGPGMYVDIGTGRAWFNHTWTLNSSAFPIEISESHALLNRTDTVALEINSDTRENKFIVVKGVPSSEPEPEKPTLTNTESIHQYPLAYVDVKAQATRITEADIENAVGIWPTPFVTGIIQTIDTGDLVAQWRAQWDEWYEEQTTKMEGDYAFWESNMADWTNNFKSGMTEWSNNYKSDMDATAEEWKAIWNEWFYTYTNQNQQEFSNWMRERDTEFRTWFDELHAVLDQDVATNLTRRVVDLESCCSDTKEFMNNLANEYAIYDDLYDNAAGHESEPILDSEGHSILNSLFFELK